jgi:hypothetical protein
VQSSNKAAFIIPLFQADVFSIHFKVHRAENFQRRPTKQTALVSYRLLHTSGIKSGMLQRLICRVHQKQTPDP